MQSTNTFRLWLFRQNSKSVVHQAKFKPLNSNCLLPSFDEFGKCCTDSPLSILCSERLGDRRESTFLHKWLFCLEKRVHFCFDKEIQSKLHYGDFWRSVNAWSTQVSTSPSRLPWGSQRRPICWLSSGTLFWSFLLLYVSEYYHQGAESFHDLNCYPS